MWAKSVAAPTAAVIEGLLYVRYLLGEGDSGKSKGYPGNTNKCMKSSKPACIL
jgi:hypothetical protein